MNRKVMNRKLPLRTVGYGVTAFAAAAGIIIGSGSPAVAAPATVHVAAGAGSSCGYWCAQWTAHTPGRVTTTPTSWGAYPYAHQTNARALDPWGETERQCVSYAAWGLNAMGVSFGYRVRGRDGATVIFGDAKDWGAAARAGGWTVSRRPVVGAVAQWNANESISWDHGDKTVRAGSLGHVGIVTKVFKDQTVLVSQYNGAADRRYSVVREKAPRYLYLGVR